MRPTLCAILFALLTAVVLAPSGQAQVAPPPIVPCTVEFATDSVPPTARFVDRQGGPTVDYTFAVVGATGVWLERSGPPTGTYAGETVAFAGRVLQEDYETATWLGATGTYVDEELPITVDYAEDLLDVSVPFAVFTAGNAGQYANEERPVVNAYVACI